MFVAHLDDLTKTVYCSCVDPRSDYFYGATCHTGFRIVDPLDPTVTTDQGDPELFRVS
jgi:hypothetical protein